jgi:hypothetical protein
MLKIADPMMADSPSSKSLCTGNARSAVMSSGILEDTARRTDPFTASGTP